MMGPVRKNVVSLSTFRSYSYRHDEFTKTGSGQTKGKVIQTPFSCIMQGWKLDHSPFMLCGGEGSTGLTLHGGTARNPFQV
jgi:hypothetical protein